MLIGLYHGEGEIRDKKDENINTITASIEFLTQLRTWPVRNLSPSQVVPIILGTELRNGRYQFAIRESSIKIGAINYSFYGETGHIFATKIDGVHLVFDEWWVSKVLPSTDNISADSIVSFLYLDSQPWDCYSKVIPDSIEYGKLAPVIDLSGSISVNNGIPPVYKDYAKIDLKVTLQTYYIIP